MNTTPEIITEETAGKAKMPVLPLILTILFAAGFILIGGLRFLIMAAVSFLCGIWAKSAREKSLREGRKESNLRAGGRGIEIIVTFIFALCSCFCFPPFQTSSDLKWKYPFQKSFIKLYHNIQEPDWFSDFLGDVRGDYRFDYMPTILQGTGHYSVRFVTDREIAERYASKLAETAVHIVRLDDNYNGSFHVENETPENYDDSFYIYKDEEFWNDASSSAKVYVLYTDYDWNHPDTSAVLIDPETGKVEFSQLG